MQHSPSRSLSCPSYQRLSRPRLSLSLPAHPRHAHLSLARAEILVCHSDYSIWDEGGEGRGRVQSERYSHRCGWGDARCCVCGQAQTECNTICTRDKHVCRISVNGRTRMRCASMIDLGYSQVILKVNNSIFKINGIIESIDVTMIYNPKSKNWCSTLC